MLQFSAINIYYQNIRGLRTKTHNFYRQLSLENYDIIILTETWLNESVCSAELFDDRYIVYRRDRNNSKKDGGGVLIAVLKSIKSKRLIQWESQCEDLWLIVEVPQMKSIRQIALCAVYLPPPVLRSTLDSFLDGCHVILERSGLHACIVGDFNLGNINWNLLKDTADNYTPPSFSSLLLDFTETHNLVQINDITNISGRILDLVLTNIPCSNVVAALNPLSTVDVLHPPFEIELKARK